jgi:hypothetical protein
VLEQVRPLVLEQVQPWVLEQVRPLVRPWVLAPAHASKAAYR